MEKYPLNSDVLADILTALNVATPIGTKVVAGEPGYGGQKNVTGLYASKEGQTPSPVAVIYQEGERMVLVSVFGENRTIRIFGWDILPDGRLYNDATTKNYYAQALHQSANIKALVEAIVSRLK